MEKYSPKAIKRRIPIYPYVFITSVIQFSIWILLRSDRIYQRIFSFKLRKWLYSDPLEIFSYTLLLFISLEKPNRNSEPKTASQIPSDNITWIVDPQINATNTNQKNEYTT